MGSVEWLDLVKELGFKNEIDPFDRAWNLDLKRKKIIGIGADVKNVRDFKENITIN